MVDASWQDENQEGILFWRVQAELRTAAEQQRTNVHRRSGAVRWHVFSVQAHCQMYALLEMMDRHFRYGYEARTVLHPLRILFYAEDIDGLVVGRTERLQTLVALLAVVEAGCHAVESEEGILDELRWCPFSRRFGEGRFDVAVDFAYTEADVVPICGRVSVSIRSGRFLEGEECTNGVDRRWREGRRHCCCRLLSMLLKVDFIDAQTSHGPTRLLLHND